MASAPPMRPQSAPSAPSAFTVSRGIKRKNFKVGIYGNGGSGKTTLASLCPGVVFVDTELSTDKMDIARVDNVRVEGNDADSWTNLRRYIQAQSSGIHCIDSVTRAEDWAASYVIKYKKTNEGQAATDSLEDFKYKAGLTFVVDEFRKFLGDIDSAYVRGASFILIAHERIKNTKNPDGSDFSRHEPRLIDDVKGTNMAPWVECMEHILSIDLDKNVTRGKAAASGSRTIYVDLAPSRICKTRTLPKDPIVFDLGDPIQIWNLLGVK